MADATFNSQAEVDEAIAELDQLSDAEILDKCAVENMQEWVAILPYYDALLLKAMIERIKVIRERVKKLDEPTNARA